MQSVICSLQSAVCGLQSAVCNLQMSDTAFKLSLLLFNKYGCEWLWRSGEVES